MTSQPRQVQTDSLDTQRWRAAGCSLVGPSHVARGADCDDSFAWATGGDWLVACVSDGAGSARFGAEGSAIVSRTVSDTVAAAFAATEEPISVEDAKRFILNAVAQARVQLGAAAKASCASLRDFHATLVGAVAFQQSALLFHIGDGAALAVRRESAGWVGIGTSSPENGEYANDTYFVTVDSWQEHLRFTQVKPFDAILLMTDGVTSFALNRTSTDGAFTFLDPLLTALADLKPEQSARVLRNLLAREDVRAACDDDKTLLWLSSTMIEAGDRGTRDGGHDRQHQAEAIPTSTFHDHRLRLRRAARRMKVR